MNLPDYMKRSYDLVTEYMKKNPESSIKDACLATGANPPSYYKARLLLKSKSGKVNRPYKRRPKMETLVVPEMTRSSRVVILVVEHHDLSNVINSLTGGNR